MSKQQVGDSVLYHSLFTTPDQSRKNSRTVDLTTNGGATPRFQNGAVGFEERRMRAGENQKR